MFIAVPPLLHSVGVKSKLYPGIWTELRLILFSFSRDLLIAIMWNVNLCSDIRVVTSSMLNQREDMFRCKKDRLFVVLSIKGVPLPKNLYINYTKCIQKLYTKH